MSRPGYRTTDCFTVLLVTSFPLSVPPLSKMSEMIKNMLSELTSVPATISNWKKGSDVGIIGLMRYPPLYSVCNVLHAVDVSWSRRQIKTTVSLSSDLKSVVMREGSSLSLHVVLFNQKLASVVPWPTRNGSGEMDLYMNEDLCSGTRDSDSRMVPGQLFIPLPVAADTSTTLELTLKKKIKPASIPENKWAQVETIAVLLVRRMEPMELSRLLSGVADCKFDSHDGRETEISLLDPITNQTLAPPIVRGDKCRHLQCFSLTSWVQTGFTSRESAAIFTWQCPVCRNTLNWKDLTRDRVLEEYIENNPDVLSIVIDPQKWSTPGYDPVVVKRKSDVHTKTNITADKKRRKRDEVECLTSLEGFGQLATLITVHVKSDIDNAIDLLRDLHSISVKRLNRNWIDASGLLRVVRQISQSSTPAAPQAEALMEKWNKEWGKVASWITQQDDMPSRVVISLEGKYFELLTKNDSSQTMGVIRMECCPTFNSYFRPSSLKTDSKTVSTNLSHYQVTGSWCHDPLLGECFKVEQQQVGGISHMFNYPGGSVDYNTTT